MFLVEKARFICVTRIWNNKILHGVCIFSGNFAKNPSVKGYYSNITISRQKRLISSGRITLYFPRERYDESTRKMHDNPRFLRKIDQMYRRNIRGFPRTLPCEQHNPSEAHRPVFRLQELFPATQGSVSWNKPSRWHFNVSGVPRRQPNGPQHMFGPKHWPIRPGPQDMH